MYENYLYYIDYSLFHIIIYYDDVTYYLKIFFLVFLEKGLKKKIVHTDTFNIKKKI